ncbi:MAG: hypothetical protein JRI43_08705, partial [Deltaproteobacteria bacterium]|nr:hypothetical protein [Deltaproteobacteria bacterium]
CVCMIASLSFTGVIRADSLFEGRQINLSNSDNRVFSVGVTGTTAGHNYLALIENARQESISLGDLGYWELVPDPPASLRNYDLQLIVRNNYTGIFQIEFEYIRYMTSSIGSKKVLFRSGSIIVNTTRHLLSTVSHQGKKGAIRPNLRPVPG